MTNHLGVFSWILIGSIVMLLRECHAWFHAAYVNTRPIDRKLKIITAMSTQQKQSVLSIKDKQTMISHLDKGEKGANLAIKF